MVVEIPKPESEPQIKPKKSSKSKKAKSKLVVNCRMCKTNFTPDPYQCPYLYHRGLGIHIPMCDECRAMIRREEARQWQWD